MRLSHTKHTNTKKNIFFSFFCHYNGLGRVYLKIYIGEYHLKDTTQSIKDQYNMFLM